MKDLNYELCQLIHTLFDAEKVLHDALLRMMSRAIGTKVKKLFENELLIKKRQQNQLKTVLSILNIQPKRLEDNQSSLHSMQEFAECADHYQLSDVAMVVLNRAITIHLINTYQKAVALCENLGYNEVAHILKKSLQIEKRIENRLRKFEESSIHFAKETVDVP